MARILWLTLMWLLAVAVPAQGFAAASMSGCGPGHHGSSVAHVHSESTTAAPEHGFAEGIARHAHAGGGFDADHDHHHEGSDATTHGVKAHGGVTKGSCSACASCCMAAALPTAVMLFQSPIMVDFFLPLASSSVVSFLTDGQERPPRSVLA